MERIYSPGICYRSVVYQFRRNHPGYHTSDRYLPIYASGRPDSIITIYRRSSQGQAHTFGRHVRIRQNNEWHWYKYHASLRDPHASGEQVELVFLVQISII